MTMNEINTKTAPLQGKLTSNNFKAVVTTVGPTIAGGAAGAGKVELVQQQEHWGTHWHGR